MHFLVCYLNYKLHGATIKMDVDSLQSGILIQDNSWIRISNHLVVLSVRKWIVLDQA